MLKILSQEWTFEDTIDSKHNSSLQSFKFLGVFDEPFFFLSARNLSRIGKNMCRS
jgi:hypothetical protein